MFFFHFFKILVFWSFKGWEGGGGVVKGQKMAQNDKKILSDSVLQEVYLIWLWLLIDV